MPARRLPWWYFAAALTLALFSLFRFRDALLTFFMLDDFWVMRDAAKVEINWITDVEQFLWFGHQGFRLYRPLTTTAYSYVLQSLFGFDSSGHHAFQLLVFALNVLLVTGVVRRLTDSAVTGVAAGLMYVLAPGQAVNAYWMSAFTVSGTTVWVLLMLWYWLVLQGWARMVVCTMLQVCAILASEHAIAAPAICLIAAWVRRECIRSAIVAIIPSALLVATYSIAKLLYLRTAPSIMGTYTVNFVPTAMLAQLGQYVRACFNVLALQKLEVTAQLGIGVAVIVVLALALVGAWRGLRGTRLLSAGTAIFIVSLIPVLVLRAHYYDHYICTAALGATLAVVGLCQMASADHWHWLAPGCAFALLAVDVANDGNAWRTNAVFRLVVNGSMECASWVKEVQRVTAEQNAPFRLHVPINPAINSLFGYGEVNKFMPGIPPHVTRYRAGTPVTMPLAVVIESAPRVRFGEALPLWDPRWDVLRRLAWWPRTDGPLASKNAADPAPKAPFTMPQGSR